MRELNQKTLIVTGGAGFIGSAFVRKLASTHRLIVLDLLTYAGDQNRIEHSSNDQITLIKGDICDEVLVNSIFEEYRPQAIIHFAAESHVDRSIDGPMEFLKTNVQGTVVLLSCATQYWKSLSDIDQELFRFLHVSTDEVYGSLSFDDPPFTEQSPYKPNSPYAASKASSDHFVRSWYKTFNLPTLITHCSNNYGPWQFPEKLIPLMISKCINSDDLPVYGDGSNIRDWIYVDDHVEALSTVLTKGLPGGVWSIGGEEELTNLHLVQKICQLLDSKVPREDGRSYADQIKFVRDRPGHDVRYAIDISKVSNELGWKPAMSFEQGLETTIDWYLNSQDWIKYVTKSGDYTDQQRLGVTT
jgi:dTDP-glucose 4,6-dehydratase